MHDVAKGQDVGRKIMTYFCSRCADQIHQLSYKSIEQYTYLLYIHTYMIITTNGLRSEFILEVYHCPIHGSQVYPHPWPR